MYEQWQPVEKISPAEERFSVALEELIAWVELERPRTPPGTKTKGLIENALKTHIGKPGFPTSIEKRLRASLEHQYGITSEKPSSRQKPTPLSRLNGNPNLERGLARGDIQEDARDTNL